MKEKDKCYKVCPLGLRADRITWSCNNPSVFSWMWVYPSRISCKGNCGIDLFDEWIDHAKLIATKLVTAIMIYRVIKYLLFLDRNRV